MQNRLTERLRQLILGWSFLIVLPGISEGAEPASFAKPEKSRLEVATAGSGTTSVVSHAVCTLSKTALARRYLAMMSSALAVHTKGLGFLL